ncbi:hypothetical protein CAEBREN_03823 [Caenorhabditis brenneri]|uniref:Uncharacterized protein n=1 Tax=Caenorhabditis brenneri TaxID=135651 RepID=G0MQQ5_CAEBE|nr:hypothetical protein CAEBREN_03823 [Caenorhabditis brenneri]
MVRRRRRYDAGQVPVKERKKKWYIESHKVKKIDECKEEPCDDQDRDLPAFEEFKEGSRVRDLERFQKQCPLLDLANALELLSEYPLAEAIKKGKERTMAPKGYVAKWIKRDLEDPLDQAFRNADKKEKAWKRREKKKKKKLGDEYVPPILRITEIREMMEAAQVPRLFKMAYSPVKWLARDLKPYLLELGRSAAVKMGLAILAQFPDDEEENAVQVGVKRGLPRVEDGSTLSKKAASAPSTMGSFLSVVTRLAKRNGLGQAPPLLPVTLPAATPIGSSLSVVTRSAKVNGVGQGSPSLAKTLPAATAAIGSSLSVVTRSAMKNGNQQAPPPQTDALPAPTVASQPARPTAPIRRSPRLH